MNKHPWIEQNAPKIALWLARGLFVCVASLFAWLWAANSATSGGGKMVFSIYLAACLIGFLGSFVRLRPSRFLVAFLLVAIPVSIFLPMDVLVLRGAWWEWLLMVPVQLGIPGALAWYILKSPDIRRFYGSRELPADEGNGADRTQQHTPHDPIR
jgi:hypothetical protein